MGSLNTRNNFRVQHRPFVCLPGVRAAREPGGVRGSVSRFGAHTPPRIAPSGGAVGSKTLPGDAPQSSQ